MSLENINQTDRIRTFSLSNCKDNSTMNTPNKDILFPKQPNKRYQTFILKEKQKHDENWENRLKDQNLTDHNFFLNYYSYEPNQELNFFPFDSSIKWNNEQKNKPVIRTPSKNVHSSLSKSLPTQYNGINKKTFTVITGKKRDEKPLYQVGSSPLNDTNINTIETNIDGDDLKDSTNTAVNKPTNESDSQNIAKEFDYLNQSIKSQNSNFYTPSKKSIQSTFSKTANFSTPSKKISQSTFSKTTNFIPASSKKMCQFGPSKSSPLQLISDENNNNSLAHFLNIDNTTQFAPFPKRQAKTSHDERRLKSAHKNYEVNQIGNPLPETRIPTRKEIIKLRAQSQNRAITSQSYQSEKFPTINNASKMPCVVFSNTITAFDLY